MTPATLFAITIITKTKANVKTFAATVANFATTHLAIVQKMHIASPKISLGRNRMPSYTTRKTKSGTVFDVRFRIKDETGKDVNKRLCGFSNKRAAQQAYLDFMKSYTPPVIEPPQGLCC